MSDWPLTDWPCERQWCCGFEHPETLERGCSSQHPINKGCPQKPTDLIAPAREAVFVDGEIVWTTP